MACGKRFGKMLKMERKEHPWLSKKQAARLVGDHLKKMRLPKLKRV